METISICLSDIPKEQIGTAKNGKKYVNLVVDKRREPDKFGNTLTVYISQTKDERERKENKVYVGSGKEYNFSQNSNASTAVNNQVEDTDDLPW